MKVISYYPVDRIATLPRPILETILCLVPIKDAVRTSILSRSWRYNWTTISKLVFNEEELFDLPMTQYNFNRNMPKIFPAIHQVLSMYQGPLLEFSLTLRPLETFTEKLDKTFNEELDKLITYLSKNNTTVKIFTLHFGWRLSSARFSLPSSFYSLYQLTDLYLHECDFYPIPTLKGGFPRLKNLHVHTRNPNGKSLVHLISISPVLKSFNLQMITSGACYRPCDTISVLETCKHLSSIEHMSLCMYACQVYKEEAPPELPSALVHLKYLCLHDMQPILQSLHALVFLIRISPNLEKIKLQLCEAWQPVQVNYPRIWLKHLRELEVTNCGENEYHLELLKFILAKSLVLKKVNIAFHNKVYVHSVEGIETMRILLQLPRASRVADINFEHPIYDLVGFKSLYTSR